MEGHKRFSTTEQSPTEFGAIPEKAGHDIIITQALAEPQLALDGSWDRMAPW